jgi:peptidoglycan hydrolase-like protein with peptidoglycan-binding domain
METLAYLHLTLANEVPTDIDYGALTQNWESIKLWSKDAIDFTRNQKKLSTRAAVSLLSLTLALTLFGMASQAAGVVQEGNSGTEVTAVQERLQQLGYFKANITGYFGPVTKEAVIQFQKDKGLEPDGIVGTNTLAALGGQSQPRLQPIKDVSSKPLPPPRPVAESSPTYLGLGSNGPEVSAIQESLAAAGFPSGARGVFDEATQKAVMRFQEARGLTVDGVIGPKTRAALPAVGGSNPASKPRNTLSRSTPKIATTEPTPRSTPRTITSRSTSSTSRDNASRSTPRTNISRLNTPTNPTGRPSTEVLQRRLQQLGFYKGEIDGIWGPQTQAALEAAQRAYDINAGDVRSQ